MLKWKPSLLATTSVYLAKKILKRPNPWCSTIQEHSGYKERLVRECAREICIVLNNVTKKKNYDSVLKKYSTNRFGRVALIPERLRQEAHQTQHAEGSTITESANSNRTSMSGMLNEGSK